MNMMQAPDILRFIPKLPNLTKKCTYASYSYTRTSGALWPTKTDGHKLCKAVNDNEVDNVQGAVLMGRDAAHFPA